MRLRVYIAADSPDRQRSVRAVDDRVRALGERLERSSEPYWKIPTLIEEAWVFAPQDAPSAAFADLMAFLGSGWILSDDSAHLTERTGAGFHYAGIRDVFLDIEPIDRGREAGILPRFALGEEVVVASDRGLLRTHAGKSATIRGHAFDHKGSQTWSYAVAIDGVATLYSADENELTSRR